MTVITARVRRDGQPAEIPAGQLLTGDIVAIEAGDVVQGEQGLRVMATARKDPGPAAFDPRAGLLPIVTGDGVNDAPAAKKAGIRTRRAPAAR